MMTFRFMTAIVLAGCVGDVPPDTSTLEAAVRQYRSEPTPEGLTAVSEAAGTFQGVSPGNPQVDLVLGDALCNVLLRPDLGLPHLEEFKKSKEMAEAEPLMDCYLRAGDLSNWTGLAQKRLKAPFNPLNVGLRTVAAHAARDASIGSERAIYAHDATALADAQHPRGRPLRLPMPDLTMALDVLQAAFPATTVRATLTRSPNASGDEPALHPDAIPSMGGRRRILGFATAAPSFSALAERLKTENPPRTVGIAAEAIGENHNRQALYCAEGRIENGQLWLLTACSEKGEARWIKATGYAQDAMSAGQTRANAIKAALERFPLTEES